MSLASSFASEQQLLVFDFTSDQGLTFSVLLGDINTELSAESTVLVAGLITIIDNPQNIPVTSLIIQIQFDFGDTPIITTVNPDINGVFIAELTTRSNLAYPEIGNLILTETSTGFPIITYDLTTPNPFSAAVSPSIAYIDDAISFSGTAEPNTSLTLDGDGLFPLQNLTATAQGNWFYEHEVLPSTPFQTYNYVVSFSGAGGTVNLSNSIADDFIAFNPKLIPRLYDTPGTTDEWTGAVTGVATRGEEIEFTLLVGTDIYFFATFNTFDVAGNYMPTGSFILPVSTQGMTAIQRFRQVSTNTTIDLTYTIPTINPTLVINTAPIFYASSGQNLDFTVTKTLGYTAVVTLKDAGLTEVAQLVLAENALGSNFPLSYANPEGTYTLEVTALNHTMGSTTFNLRHGMVVTDQTPDGLVFIGDTVTVAVNSVALDTVDVVGFGTSYIVNIDGSNDGTLSEVVPVTASFGTNTLIFTSQTYGLDTQQSLNIEIADPADYVLSAIDPGDIFTNGESDSISGLALPGKLVTITIPELSVNSTVTANNFGIWQLTTNFAWFASGTYTLTISAPSEIDVIFSGNHRPKLEILPNPIIVSQGDASSTFQVRGDTFETILVQYSSLFNSEQVTADVNGFATFNRPSIPLNIDAPTSLGFIATTLPISDSENGSISIAVRLPLTWIVTNPPPGVPATILFTNQIYNITGNSPDGLPLSISITGENDGFDLLTNASDVYTGTLDTGAIPGNISVLVSTLYQPNLIRNYTIADEIILTVPSGLIDSLDPIFNMQADSVPNIEINFEVDFKNAGNNVYSTIRDRIITDGAGTALLSIDPSQITEPGTIEFRTFTVIEYVVEEIRSTSVAGVEAYNPGSFDSVGLISYMNLVCLPECRNANNFLVLDDADSVGALVNLIATGTNNTETLNTSSMQNKYDEVIGVNAISKTTEQLVKINGGFPIRGSTPHYINSPIGFTVNQILSAQFNTSFLSIISSTSHYLDYSVASARVNLISKTQGAIGGTIPVPSNTAFVLTYVQELVGGFLQERTYINGVPDIVVTNTTTTVDTTFSGYFQDGNPGRSLFALWDIPKTDAEVAALFDNEGRLIPLRPSLKSDYALHAPWAFYDDPLDSDVYGRKHTEDTTGNPFLSFFRKSMPIRDGVTQVTINNTINRPNKNNNQLVFNGLNSHLHTTFIGTMFGNPLDFVLILKRTILNNERQTIFSSHGQNNNFVITVSFLSISTIEVVTQSTTVTDTTVFNYDQNANFDRMFINFKLSGLSFPTISISLNNIPLTINTPLITTGGGFTGSADDFFVGCDRNLSNFCGMELDFISPIELIGANKFYSGTLPLFATDDEHRLSWIYFILGFPQFWQALEPTHPRSLDGVFYI